MKRRILSTITALAMCLSLFTPALAAVDYNVDYLDANGSTRTCSSATEVTAGDTGWGYTASSELWYVAKDSITIDERVTITGDVHLILANDCTLTVNGGIRVSEGNRLTIYAQSIGNDMGALTATAASNDDAAIGGSLTVSEGIITDNGACGTVTINGGRVTATSNGGGAGIGGGVGTWTTHPDGGTVTINGGIIEAYGYGGAGIGSGDNGSGGSVTINGGTVTASGTYGAGIGGGNYTDGGTITISGGTVAASSTYGAGIGGGTNGGSGTFSTGAGGAVIFADSIADADDTSGWSGIIFQGDDGQVHGTPALTEDATIPADKTLEVGEGAALTIPSDVTLTVTGPLTNNGTIQIEGTLDVTSLTNHGSLTGAGTLLIGGQPGKLNQGTAPAAPTVQSVTANSVTLVKITGGAGAEYKCGDGEEWQDSPVFTGLESATEYTFYARYKGSKFYNASPASTGRTVSTAAAAVINYGAETIGFDDSTCEMNTAQGFAGTAISSGGSLTEYIGQTLYIRVKEAGGVPASEAVAVSIPDRPGAPTGLTATRDDYTVSDNGIISGVSGEMEYKLSTAKDWTDCAGDTITGLSVGTYLVRVKATDSAFSGTAAEVSILPSCQRR